MLGYVHEVVMLDEKELRSIIAEVNKEYNTFEGQQDWFDPDDTFYLFWDYQDFGSDCYMKLDVSRTTIDYCTSTLSDYILSNHDEHIAWIYRIRIRVLEYIRKRIPSNIDTIMIHISY